MATRPLRTGTTLTELMVVLSIIGLMAAISGPSAAVAPAPVGQFGPPGVVGRDLDGLPPSVVVMAHRADERLLLTDLQKATEVIAETLAELLT